MMRPLSRGQAALLASVLIHAALFAVVGLIWRWDADRSLQPIYVEVTMAELLAPVHGAPNGGSPGGLPNPIKPRLQPRAEAASTETKEPPAANSPGGASNASVIGGSAGTGGPGGPGGGVGPGNASGTGNGNGTGSGPTRGPRLVDGARPEYPEGARAKGREGTVKIQILVGIDGRVEDVRLAASSGYAELDQAAQSAVRSWRFSPALQKGLPVAAWATLPIVFDLR